MVDNSSSKNIDLYEWNPEGITTAYVQKHQMIRILSLSLHKQWLDGQITLVNAILEKIAGISTLPKFNVLAIWAWVACYECNAYMGRLKRTHKLMKVFTLRTKHGIGSQYIRSWNGHEAVDKADGIWHTLSLGSKMGGCHLGLQVNAGLRHITLPDWLIKNL